MLARGRTSQSQRRLNHWSWPRRWRADFNNNGTIDAADYLIWRRNDGSQEGYENWRANFGRVDHVILDSGLASVPEPSTLCLLLGACGICRRRSYS